MNRKQFSWSRSILISLPFFALTLFWQAYDYVVPLILSRHYHLSTTLYSVIMSVDNLIAIIFLPLFGIISDRISGKLGRRTPLILIGTAGGIIGLFFMNMEDAKAVAGNPDFIPFLIFLLTAVFFMSLYRSPSAALVADCFIRPQRTLANAVLNLMAGIAGVCFGVVGHMLISEHEGTMFFSGCLLFVMSGMLAATGIYLAFARENRFVREVQEKNLLLGLTDEKTDDSHSSPTRLSQSERRSFLLILGSVFFIYMGYNGFHTHYTNYLVSHLAKSASWTGPYLLEVGVGMVMMIPAAFITARIGRKKSCLVGTAACVIGYLGVSTVSAAQPDLIYLWFLIAAIGFPLFAINLGPMVLEVAKDRDSGRYMGYYYVAVTGAQIVTPTLASLFINACGYRIIGIYGAICTAIAFCAMLPVRHGNVKVDLRRALQDSTAVDD